MDVTRASITACVLLTCAIGAGAAGAEGVWSWSEEFCASAAANVFDGGQVMSEEGCGSDSNGSGVRVSAFDVTQAGAMGASALASAGSTLLATEDVLSMWVELIAGYFPSFLPGGDNPGGMAEAAYSTVIEFEMPADELQWFYELDIDYLHGSPFTGATHILIENVTRSEILVEMDAEVDNVETVLQGSTGDLIRITSDMMGSGSMGPGSQKVYAATLRMQFVVPEPGTLSTLGIGAVLLVKRRRRANNSLKPPIV